MRRKFLALGISLLELLSSPASPANSSAVPEQLYKAEVIVTGTVEEERRR